MAKCCYIPFQAKRLALLRQMASPKADDGKLKLDKMEMFIDPKAEWAQMFDEFWRIERDFLYAPNMHGADWPAIKEKYRPS